MYSGSSRTTEKEAATAASDEEEVAAFRLVGLHKRFGEHTAVDHADLTVAPGSFYGLVGPNGAGKTTVLSMATGGTDVAQLKRHGAERRMATLVATVAQLEASATDDALELLELLWATELAGKARTAANKETIKKHPRPAKASAMLAVVAQVLLEARTWGEEEDVRVAEVWGRSRRGSRASRCG